MTAEIISFHERAVALRRCRSCKGTGLKPLVSFASPIACPHCRGNGWKHKSRNPSFNSRGVIIPGRGMAYPCMICGKGLLRVTDPTLLEAKRIEAMGRGKGGKVLVCNHCGNRVLHWRREWGSWA